MRNLRNNQPPVLYTRLQPRFPSLFGGHCARFLPNRGFKGAARGLAQQRTRAALRYLLVLACCVTLNLPGSYATAQLPGSLTPPPLPRAQAEIYSRVTSRVLAPCCWSEPVRAHQSGAAEKVRAEVVGYVRRGIGEPEILDRLATEYGERILGEPRGARGAIAIGTPFVTLLASLTGLLFLLSHLTRRRPRPIPFTGPLPEISEFEL